VNSLDLVDSQKTCSFGILTNLALLLPIHRKELGHLVRDLEVACSMCGRFITAMYRFDLG